LKSIHNLIQRCNTHTSSAASSLKAPFQISPFPSSQPTKTFLRLRPNPLHHSTTTSYTSKQKPEMDSSSYFGEPNLGNERSSASSSRKGKKNNSDKPKQPQRGLGVAQLEKIRLHSQMASGYHHSSLHGPYPSTFTNVNLHFLLLLLLLK